MTISRSLLCLGLLIFSAGLFGVDAARPGRLTNVRMAISSKPIVQAQPFLRKFARDMLVFPSSNQPGLKEMKALIQVLQAWKGLNSSALPPVLLVPGLGSSVLEGSLTQYTDSPCAKSLFNGVPGVWRDLWINTNAILQTARSGCLYEYMGLRWNGTDFSDHSHVKIRAKDWGGLGGVSTLVSGPNKMRLYPYFQNIIKAFLSIGYTEGVDLRAAPYDWRKGYLPELYPKMRELVEEMYNASGGKPVWIVAHSMGGWQSTIMLSMQSAEWKQRYIAGFITLGTPWFGASSSILAILSGLDINLRVGPVQIIDAEKLHRILRTFGSLVWLLPRTLLSDTGFLIKVENEKMNMRHYFDALNRLGLKTTSSILSQFVRRGYMKAPFKAPGVPLHCMYGNGIPTKMAVSYSEKTMTTYPDIIMARTGDGTVPLKSLRGCFHLGWGQKEPVRITEFEGVNHNSILSRPTVLKALVRTILDSVFPVKTIVG